MPVIVVANPKGGVGKSTLATQVAGFYARQGHAVMLGDTDKQQSARQWLALRPAELPTIQYWDLDHEGALRAPKGTTHCVLDTPAGLDGKRLDQVLKVATHVLVPLQASLFDIQATHAFMQSLASHPRGKDFAVRLVGMRVRDRSQSISHLQAYLQTLPVPVVAWLRDTQNYVHLAAHGLTLFDVAPSRVERDLEQWLPLIKWLET